MASSANGQETGGFNVDPMHQFEVTPIFKLPEIAGIDPSFTNSSLWMVIVVAAATLFLTSAALRGKSGTRASAIYG